MSKAKKLQARDRRRKEKANAKATQQAKYAAWAAEGKNSKSARSKARAQDSKRTPRMGRHRNGPCGNVGCAKCNPSNATHPDLAPVGSIVRAKLWRCTSEQLEKYAA